MRFSLPTPSHGWRPFVTEIAIVVIGVLIALGAQQAVDAVSWRIQVQRFREAMDDELSWNLATLGYRRDQRACVTARLGELETLLRSWRDGDPRTLTGPIARPSGLSARTSVWGARSEEVTAHLPFQVRLAYGRLYDTLANIEETRRGEREIWRELSDFDEAANLDHQDLMRLRGLITRGRGYDRLIEANAPAVQRLATELKLEPRLDPGTPQPGPDLCKPILSPAPT